jgi:hypothetical protein
MLLIAAHACGCFNRQKQCARFNLRTFQHRAPWFTASALPLKRTVFDHRCLGVLGILTFDLEQFHSAQFGSIRLRFATSSVSADHRASFMQTTLDKISDTYMSKFPHSTPCARSFSFPFHKICSKQFVQMKLRHLSTHSCFFCNFISR